MLLIHAAAAISVNVTVDDSFGNTDRTVIPTYIPANDTWHVGSPSEECGICTIKPSELDIDQILDQSWHHATYFLGIPIQVEVTFPGTAVYVYSVVPNFLPNGAITLVNVTFALDGETVGQFFHAPDSSSEILYSHLVYANASLSDAVHTLVMSAAGSERSLIFFDYLVYTTEIEETTTSGSATVYVTPSMSPTTTPLSDPSSASARQLRGAIVGGVIGGVLFLLSVAVSSLFLVLNRRHRRQARPL
uniref:Chitin synthase C n=1 Tax=Ganoderma boninense TaxID=34458 RepID=A0A5K1K0K3_9APHY|nr:Chitin synthase C [Ganoderma boninense]